MAPGYFSCCKFGTLQVYKSFYVGVMHEAASAALKKKVFFGKKFNPITGEQIALGSVCPVYVADKKTLGKYPETKTRNKLKMDKSS
jgi:hypothetical protein